MSENNKKERKIMELTNHEKIEMLKLAVYQAESDKKDYKQIYKDIVKLLSNAG